ncbi:MAG TPA: VOC family protein [bacterium]|nr:VOC family protein [bacterium]
MIDHVSFQVRDWEASKRFYLGALKPLGYTLLHDFKSGGGFGADGKPDVWISVGQAKGTLHLALSAKNRQTVDAFHAAALQAGGRDNGKPGLRPNYHPNYYGAFVLDPDGNNVEAVCHTPG